jgi:iron complex transport system ATP-binding protein
MGMELDSPAFIEMKNISVARGEAIVLHDLSLRIGPQEHIAILGPNGCGKSTLIRTLTCQIYPLAREESLLRIFGRERWDVSELRRHLGVVASELPGERTAHTSGRDVVISGFFSSSTVWPHLHVTPQMEERAEEILHLLEIDYLRRKPVGQMSAGETKRILIGRALVHRPQILLLDEPSNALDMAAQWELRHTLRRLAQQGTGILLVTHHLSDVLPEIERVVMMRNGRIVADGTKAELLTAPRLRDLFGVDVELGERNGFYHAW